MIGTASLLLPPALSVAATTADDPSVEHLHQDMPGSVCGAGNDVSGTLAAHVLVPATVSRVVGSVPFALQPSRSFLYSSSSSFDCTIPCVRNARVFVFEWAVVLVTVGQ